MVQEEIEQQLTDLLRQEIDREIVVEISVTALLAQGWILVKFDDDADLGGIDLWMQDNIHRDWRLFHGRAVFIDPEEAMLFQLRWA